MSGLVTSSFRSFAITLGVCVSALLIAAYVTLNVNAGWGIMLFLLFVIFIGIPLVTREGNRMRRMFIYTAALLVCLLMALFGVRYDPFAIAKPFKGTRCAQNDVTVHNQGVSFKLYGAQSRKTFTCYVSGDEYHWMMNGAEARLGGSIAGQFMPAPGTELDVLAEHYRDPKIASSGKAHVGYVLRSDTDISALTLQRLLTLAFFVLFILAFALDEMRYQRKEKPSVEYHADHGHLRDDPDDKERAWHKNAPA